MPTCNRPHRRIVSCSPRQVCGSTHDRLGLERQKEVALGTECDGPGAWGWFGSGFSARLRYPISLFGGWLCSCTPCTPPLEREYTQVTDWK